MERSRNRTTRRALLGVAALVVATTMTACGSDDSSSKGGGDGTEHFTVAYVPGVTPNPYYDTVMRGMQTVAKKNKITLDYQGPATFDPTEQTKVLNAVLTQRPDFLLAGPVDPVALRAPIERFIRAKIPVITVDGPMADTSGILGAIQNNASQGGQLAGKEMARISGGSGTVAIINIVSGNAVLDARVEGFKNGLAAAAPDVKLAPINNAGGNPSASQAAARSLALAYPDLKGIFAVTESNAEGAAAGLKAAGKTDAISIIGWDASPTEVKLLRSGDLKYLIVSQAEREGEMAMQHAIDHLRKKGPKMEKSIMVDTVGVSLENIDDPEISQVLYGPAAK